MTNHLAAIMTSAMSSNMTQLSSSDRKVMDTIHISLLAILLTSSCLFIFFVCLILHIFLTTPHIRENTRYILFAHMLINDTLYLVDGLFLALTATNYVYFPFPICYVFHSIGTITFRITPHNLAAMALEQYAAICFPLRHATLCTPQRSKYAIAIICFIDLIPTIIDFIILCVMGDKRLFTLFIICKREYLTVNLAQSLVTSSFLSINLASVGLIILFTYIRVMYIAKNMSSRHGSAQKAAKTVMIHAGQFLLCLFSLTSSLIETKYRNTQYVPLINFLIFMCLPRLLSPVIYGLRDQLLRKYLRNLQLVKF